MSIESENVYRGAREFVQIIIDNVPTGTNRDDAIANVRKAVKSVESVMLPEVFGDKA